MRTNGPCVCCAGRAGLLSALPGLSDVTYSLEKEEGAVTCHEVVREQNEMHTASHTAP